MKEEPKLIGLGFVTGCAAVVSREDAVLDESMRVLYDDAARFNPANPNAPWRDRIILSKGPARGSAP
jgi:transketolase N-terminal domain/subunit